MTDSKIDRVTGKFITLDGERYYEICHVDKMSPFFISLVSDNDHWLFASSNGGLTAGRVSPETPLFPYVTVDKIHDSPVHTGCKTLIRVEGNNQYIKWEPFNFEHDGFYSIDRHLYKNVLGNRLCFVEINHDLKLVFKYSWMTSDTYGFVRQSELENFSNKSVHVDIVDGFQNILPAGTPSYIQNNSSNLVDAYKWSELDEVSGLAMFTLYSGITDRAEPCESLKANTVFSIGLEGGKTLLCSEQLDHFRMGVNLTPETRKRGIRGAYLVNKDFELAPKSTRSWKMIANVEQTQSQVVDLCKQLKNRDELLHSIVSSVKIGSEKLARIIAASDGFQVTAEENVSTHHYANTLFNVLRGGIFNDQYCVDTNDFSNNIYLFNQKLFKQHRDFLLALPAKINFFELQEKIKSLNDHSLQRLCYEYLPITFGRRHGDPSRPWNQFAIKLKDEQGKPLLTYQGNWRDIFQNWEALCLSFPEFIENVIAKFINASTMDGYNPYRITSEGIDWEVEDPDDPWSYIGYWGDHQIIYLLKLLELSNRFHPGRLAELLRNPVFSYANVPYRIKTFESIIDNAKSTVTFDNRMAAEIEQRVATIGSDGKLVLDSNGKVYQVNLLEKLLVPLLSKLGNFVLDGGVWMNTQRPEWNDANNALVGHGLSMVTLYYMRRYVHFIQRLIEAEKDAVILTTEISDWISELEKVLSKAVKLLNGGPVSSVERRQVLTELGQAASHYRQKVYFQQSKTRVEVYPLLQIKVLLRNTKTLIDQSIKNNQREDKLYHAYNLIHFQSNEVELERLYLMLEGQVAVLSSGVLTPVQAVTVVQALFSSNIYRPDQKSFMLYPDRELPGFLQKNVIAADDIKTIPLISELLTHNDDSIVLRDDAGDYRFNADIFNVSVLHDRLDKLAASMNADVESARLPLISLYESVFNHKAFTGRSGGMFGFEGLGCIYWHMVSKLLLAIQENFFNALDQRVEQHTIQALADCYYKVRQGIGFNKTPQEYGAFPTDPYSHTPKHTGAQQPGMTGQVKEEILTRFGELGILVNQGEVDFQPALLRAREFLKESRVFEYLDVNNIWREIDIPEKALGFSWCQVPFIYQLTDESSEDITLILDDDKQIKINSLHLSAQYSQEIFKRSGRIKSVSIVFAKKHLYLESKE